MGDGSGDWGLIQLPFVVAWKPFVELATLFKLGDVFGVGGRGEVDDGLGALPDIGTAD